MVIERRDMKRSCSEQLEPWITRDGEAYLLRAFIDPDPGWVLYRRLRQRLDWRQETITVYGRHMLTPRLTCWYGDPGAAYTYSGMRNDPRPWPPELTGLRQRIEALTGYPFNSVLANLYRNGSDSVGWHGDKERELGQNPVIASVSLGVERCFRLRHNKTRETVDIVLPHGSLLIMSGALQHGWRHCIPKTRRVTAGRVNLTFRYVHGSA